MAIRIEQALLNELCVGFVFMNGAAVCLCFECLCFMDCPPMILLLFIMVTNDTVDLSFCV